MINLIIIILIITVMCYLAYKYIKDLDSEDSVLVDEIEEEVDIPFLIEETKKVFAALQTQSFEDANLSRSEMARKNKRKEDVSKALRLSAFGHKESKRLIISYIKDILQNEQYDIYRKMNTIIPFDDYTKMTGNDLFEIILYIYQREYEDRALDEFFKEFKIQEHTEKPRPAVFHLM